MGSIRGITTGQKPGRTETSLNVKSLFVGNIPYSATEKDLFDFFAEFDPKSVRIVEGRGFGFVDIPDENVAEAIEAKNGKELGGRRVVVNEARPRERRK
ncbi:MAG: hypothetical protein QXI19_09505 [Candidatus Caldarchaeum sp.]